MGADVTGTNKRQIASAHGQAEGALQSGGRSLLLALVHRRKHGAGGGYSEEAAGFNPALTHSPLPKMQQVTFELKPLTKFLFFL